MSTLYAVALGHNVPAVNLTPLVPQPSSVGVVPGRTEYPAGGGKYEDTHYVELVWNVLEDGADYRSLLVQLGLNNADTALVTLRVRDDNFNDWRVNATVYRPEHGRTVTWRTPFVQGVTILARDLKTVSA